MEKIMLSGARDQETGPRINWDLALPSRSRNAASTYNNPVVVSAIVYGNVCSTMSRDHVEDLAAWTEWVYGDIDVSFVETRVSEHRACSQATENQATESDYDFGVFVSPSDTIFEDVASIIYYHRSAIYKPFLFVHKDVEHLNALTIRHNRPELNQVDVTIFLHNAVLATNPKHSHKRFLDKIYAHNKHN